MLLSPRAPRRRRPMGLRMWTVMRLHLFCLVSQKPSLLSSLLLLNSSLRSRRTETQAVLCACLPLEIESSCRGRQLELNRWQARRFASWFFGTGCFGGGVVRQKSWLRSRGCGALLLAAVAF